MNCKGTPYPQKQHLIFHKQQTQMLTKVLDEFRIQRKSAMCTDKLNTRAD